MRAQGGGVPSRVIRGEINSSDSLSRVSLEADLTFRALIVVVDDFGRFDARPAILKAALFPLRDTVSVDDVSAWVGELDSEGCVKVYTVGDRPYLQLSGWEQHSGKSRRATKSKYPDIPEGYDLLQGNAGKSLQMQGNPCKSPRESRVESRESRSESREVGLAASPPRAPESEPDQSSFGTGLDPPIEAAHCPRHGWAPGQRSCPECRTIEHSLDAYEPEKPEDRAGATISRIDGPRVQPEADRPAQAKGKRKKRGSQCPETLKSEQWEQVRAWRSEKWPELSDKRLEAEWEAHRDWHLKYGTPAVNWVRSFYSWLRKARTFDEGKPLPPRPTPAVYKSDPKRAPPPATEEDWQEYYSWKVKNRPARHAQSGASAGNVEDETEEA